MVDWVRGLEGWDTPDNLEIAPSTVRPSGSAKLHGVWEGWRGGRKFPVQQDWIDTTTGQRLPAGHDDDEQRDGLGWKQSKPGMW